MYSDLKLMATYKEDHKVVNSKNTSQIGDCMIKNNKAYIYGAKDEWIELGGSTILTGTSNYCDVFAYYDSNISRTKPTLHKLTRKTCSACGAPMHGYICEYCGSEYY